MMTTYKPYTVTELAQQIYEDNYSHIEFNENMGGADCDCATCTTLRTIVSYMEEPDAI